MPRFPSGQNELLKNSFFQHDSKLNKSMEPVTPMTSTNVFFRKDGDFRHTGKVGPRTLRWDPRPRTVGWDPKVGSYGGTLRWDSKVGPYGGTLRWDPTVRP